MGLEVSLTRRTRITGGRLARCRAMLPCSITLNEPRGARMPLFPLFVDLRDREVLVVGGGDVATRKIQALLRAGAQVLVHARELAPALQALEAEGRLQRLHGDAVDPRWIERAWLVVAATDDHALNRSLASQA